MACLRSRTVCLPPGTQYTVSASARLGEELGLVRATGAYSRWLGKLAKTQVLILDDWGLVALDAPCREALMEIIDDRAGNRATLITSQLPVDHWHAWIDEPAVADAMLDRLLPQAQRIVLKGESLRAARTKKNAFIRQPELTLSRRYWGGWKAPRIRQSYNLPGRQCL